MQHKQEGVCTSGRRGRVFALQGISKSSFSSDRGVFGCFRAGAWIHIAFVQVFVLTHLWRICITVFVLVRRFCYTEHCGVSCSQVLFAQFFLVLKQVFPFKPSRSVCLLYSGYVFIVLWNFEHFGGGNTNLSSFWCFVPKAYNQCFKKVIRLDGCVAFSQIEPKTPNLEWELVVVALRANEFRKSRKCKFSG